MLESRGMNLSRLSAVLLLSGVAPAAPIYFLGDPTTQRTAFEAAAGGTLILESFETTFTSSLSVSFPIGGPVAFTVTSDHAIFSDTFSRGVSDGSRSIAFAEEGANSLRFTFVNPIFSFGIDLNDLNFTNASYLDSNGNTRVNALLGDSGGPLGGPTFENRQFFGVVDPQGFTFVQFQTNGTASGTIFLDRLQYGTSFPAVPEPASAGLVALGLFACWKARRFAPHG